MPDSPPAAFVPLLPFDQKVFDFERNFFSYLLNPVFDSFSSLFQLEKLHSDDVVAPLGFFFLDESKTGFHFIEKFLHSSLHRPLCNFFAFAFT